MTGEEFLKLVHDNTDLLIRTVIANNPQAIAGNISAAHLNSPNPELNNPYTIIMNLWNRGKYSEVAHILNVPYLPNNLPPGYDDFFREVVQIKPTAKMIMKSDTASGGNWWSNMDWGGIIDSIGGLYLDITGGQNTSLQDNNVSNQPPVINMPAQDNTMLYVVGGGIALLIIALLVYLAAKK